ILNLLTRETVQLRPHFAWWCGSDFNGKPPRPRSRAGATARRPKPPGAAMHRLLVLLCILLDVAGCARAQAPSADLSTLAQGNAPFGVRLHGQLRAGKDNLFYSPYSISTALAMTSAGARGPTLAQMEQVLHFRLQQPQLHAACAELTRTLNGHGLPRDYQLHVANPLWGEQTLPFHDDFQPLIKAHYGARVRPVNFIRAHEQARRQINRWVEERTNDKVKELVKPKVLDEWTRLVLVN